MQRLSSRSTFFFKRVFPAFRLGFPALKSDPMSMGIQCIDMLRQRRPA